MGTFPIRSTQYTEKKKNKKKTEPSLTCGAASNIVKSRCKCSSNSNIAATLPHLQIHRGHIPIFGVNMSYDFYFNS